MYRGGEPTVSHGTHVWVRTDLVEAICRNGGTLPTNWRPRKRHRDEDSDGDSWGWCRAIVSSAKTPRGAAAPTPEQPNPASPFKVRLRKTANSPSLMMVESPERVSKTVEITLTVDDPELAPPELQNVTVSFTYNTADNSKVCTANTWWSEVVRHDNNDNGEIANMPPDDLTSLEQLHEPAVVFCLKRRYDLDQIYTYTGKILLALNPFRPIDHLYAPSVMQQYWQQDHFAGTRPSPHIFAVAEDAYRSMVRALQMKECQNQSILVSGECGAGKTVTTKIIMRYLATLSQQQTHHEEDVGIEAQVLQSNPILESFGNARTVRNDNSSRFGKFIEIRFEQTGCLVSASVETYLLEKVRLISQAEGERNYHIFYELLAGLSQKERRDLNIGNVTPRDFRMTAASGTFDRRDGVDDRETYRELRHALDTVGFSEQDQFDLFLVVCALLHTSNLTFNEKEMDASALDKGNPSLRSAVSLLGVDVEVLEDALCRCAIEARGEVLYKNLSIMRAEKAVEALIKTTYSALFQHIVQRVNSFIAASATRESNGRSFRITASIGVLDIFGFESFEVNSFEQLCINYCNEALQQQFNRFVFKLEQQEYQREGIDWSFIAFPDNQDVLDLIEKKHDGIFSVLDEQSRLPRCTDATFAQAVYDKCSEHPRFEVTKAQQADLTFSIHHYAGLVEYDTINFLEKNKDELPKETTELLKSSSNPFLASLGRSLSEMSGSSSSVLSSNNSRSRGRRQLHRSSSSLLRESVGSQFSSQLRQLRTRIETTSPHYVRCLKPNDDLVPNLFNSLVIADQLRCAGVLEAIRVSRVGFPHRYSHERFVQRYSILARKQIERLFPRKGYKPSDVCESLVESLTPKLKDILGEEMNTPKRSDAFLGMQMGKTKVFLRRRAFDALEHMRGKRLEDAASKIQSLARMHLARNRLETAIYAAVTIQNFFRQIGAYRAAQSERIDRSVLRIQCGWRCSRAGRVLSAARYIAFWCQSMFRGAIARQLCAYVFLDKKASVIQRAWKYHKSTRYFRSLRRAVVSIQNRHRCRLARQQLLHLRREARDLTVVAAERDKLRDETMRLQKELEKAKNSPAKVVYKTPSKAEKSEEVAKLKLELQRLQLELSKAHRMNTSAQNNEEEIRALAEELARREDELEILRQELLTLRSHNDSFSIKSFVIETGSAPRGSQSKVSPLTQKRSSPARSDVSLLDEAMETNVSKDNEVLSPFAPVIGNSMSVEPTLSFSSSPRQSDGHELRYLHAAIRQGNQKLFDQILKQTTEAVVLVNLGDQYGRTALHLASLSLNLEMASALLDKGAVVNAQDNDGETPLHLAENVLMTELLLDKGKANPNIPNIDGICALHLAVQRRDIDSARALLRKNASVNNADNIRWFTPLHLIALPPRNEVENMPDEEMCVRIAQMLTGPCGSDEPDLDYQDREGNAPLHYAVQLDTDEAAGVVSTLLEKGADPNVVNERNQGPLHLLCHNEDLRASKVFHEVLHSILFHGGDPNLQSLTGCTPLHLSLYHRDIDSAIQLVGSGAELHLLWKKVGMI